jgi:hypothetical protein
MTQGPGAKEVSVLTMGKRHDFLDLEGNAKDAAKVSYTFWRLLDPVEIGRRDGAYGAK